MKYSLTFLYALLLKEGYIVEDVIQTENKFDLTLLHKAKRIRWSIILEPGAKDKSRNVTYLIIDALDGLINEQPKSKIYPIIFSRKEDNDDDDKQ